MTYTTPDPNQPDLEPVDPNQDDDDDTVTPDHQPDVEEDPDKNQTITVETTRTDLNE